jgi:predicted dehydrogenase
MSDNQKIRVGIVGAGANTRLRHIPGLQAQPDVEVVAVANRSRQSGEAVARDFGIPTVYDTWLDLMRDDTIDAVAIGTWPYMHCQLTLAALEAGKHVLCEARMAMDAVEARSMLDAARARPHLIAQVVPSPYTLKYDRTVRRLLAEGFVGEALTVDVQVGGAFIDRDSPLHWRHDFGFSGYNTMTMGIWYEAVMRWVGEATRVVALTRTFVRTRRDADGALHALRIPDHVDILADLACGAQLRMQVSAVTGLADPPSITVYGDRGTLRLSGEHLLGGQKGDRTLSPIEIPAHEVDGWRVEEQFIAAIRGQQPVRLTTFEDGVRYMEFTEAVARSSASGIAVSLPL